MPLHVRAPGRNSQKFNLLCIMTAELIFEKLYMIVYAYIIHLHDAPYVLLVTIPKSHKFSNVRNSRK